MTQFGGQKAQPPRQPPVLVVAAMVAVVMLLWISSSEVLNVTEPVELRLVWLKYQDQMVSSLSVGLVLICGLYVMSERENARREREAREQLLEAYACTMGALTSALDLRDSETWGHSQRVTLYSLEIGRRMNLDDATLHSLSWGALLHDVGKIGVPDSILLKAGPLTLEEKSRMDEHVEIGYHLVSTIPALHPALEVIRFHHERYDGGGYPAGLSGENIPMSARIFSVADAFDAMTSARPYRRNPLTFRQARAELTRLAGVQFCPEAVQAFCTLTDAELLQIRSGSYAPMIDFRQFLRGKPYEYKEARDQLTGAFTRNSWEATRTQLLRFRGPDLGNLIFIDVDGLKAANDRSGHATGDLVLGDAGRRLVEAAHPEAALYRYGGDEFIVWAPPGANWDRIVERVTAEARAFEQYWAERHLKVSLSMGIGIPQPNDTLDDLVRTADSLMYAHKAGKRKSASA